jgi:uncharacterized protein YukE
MRPDGSPALVSDAADAISQAGSHSGAARHELRLAAARPAWTGEAAESFRAGAARMDGTFAALVNASDLAARTLRAYAAELTRLQQDADSLADQFARYGITIDSVGRAAPTPGLHDPVTLDDNLRRYGDLFEDQARGIRIAADRAAAEAINGMDNARALLHERTGAGKYLRDQFTRLTGATNTVYSAYTTAAGTHALVTEEYAKKEGMLRELRKNAERKTSRVRIAKAWAAYYEALHSSAAQRQALRETAAMTGALTERLPFSKELSTTLGQAVRDKSLPGGLSRVAKAPVARGLPVAGTVLTGIQIRQDIAEGSSPTKTITANLASLAAGSVAAEGAVVLATGIGLAAGAPVVAGLVVGTAVAVGVGYAVNAFFETQVGHDIAQTVDHAVGDAADAVGDAVSGAWRRVFG